MLHQQFMSPLIKIMDAILSTDPTPKQSLGIQKLCSVFEKYKDARYREIIYFMRDLKAKNVFNFSRSRLFEKLSKSKLAFDQRSNNALFDYEAKHLS